MQKPCVLILDAEEKNPEFYNPAGHWAEHLKGVLKNEGSCREIFREPPQKRGPSLKISRHPLIFQQVLKS